MLLTRRSFLKGILAVGIAPAICKAEYLMRGSGILVPREAGDIVIPVLEITVPGYVEPPVGYVGVLDGVVAGERSYKVWTGRLWIPADGSKIDPISLPELHALYGERLPNYSQWPKKFS